MSELETLKLELADLAKQMNARHLRIAKGLANGLSQEKAYVAAGTKSKNPSVDSHKTIKNYPVIIQYKELFQKIAQLEALPKQIATFEQKKQLLWDIANRCTEDMQEKYSGHGDQAEFVGYVFDSRGAIAAISELNKMDGDLAAIKTDNKHAVELQELSEEQLDARIRELQTKAGTGKAS